MDGKKVKNFIVLVQHARGGLWRRVGAPINFFGRVTLTMYTVCLKPIQFRPSVMIYKITFLLSKSGHDKIDSGKQLPYTCVWFSTKKIFQCVTAPRSLFLTTQKTCLLKTLVALLLLCTAHTITSSLS